MAVQPHLDRPAFYALRRGGWRDLVTLLHPPYTLWHLSYVALGAAAAPAVHTDRLLAALAAFFLALGIAAHALDEFHDRPLGAVAGRRRGARGRGLLCPERGAAAPERTGSRVAPAHRARRGTPAARRRQNRGDHRRDAGRAAGRRAPGAVGGRAAARRRGAGSS